MTWETNPLRAYLQKWMRDQGFDDSDADIEDVLLDAAHKPLWSGEVDRHRWWTEYDCVIKIGDKFTKFSYAMTDGDISAHERGWEFDFDTIVEVVPVQRTVTVYEVLR